MNSQTLALDHGALLRLTVPVKYGIKYLKRIGTLEFSRGRPPDCWAEQGYDYDSGHRPKGSPLKKPTGLPSASLFDLG